MTTHILNDLPQQKVSGSIMKHPLVRTAQSLTGMALVLMGLSVYGCGDSGTTTQPAELGNLSVSDGDLQPAFNPANTSYTVQLPTDVSSTTITASPRVAGDTIRIDNQQVTSQTVTLNSPGAEQSVNIVVTETGTGGTSKSYTVQVKRATLAGNNSLTSLTVSPGTLAPDFEKSTTRYTVSVGNNVGSITITPTLSDPAATMTVSGKPALSGQARTTVLNGGGQVTTIPIAITAQDGSTQSYEVAVSRGPSNNNNLQGLTASSGNLAPTFRANRTAYTVNVGTAVASVTVRPTLADTTATMTVNGQAATSGQQSQTITLNGPGSSTVISIIVIAQNGTPKPYTVNVVRAALGGNNNLSTLAVSPGTLDPAFSASTTSYTVDVASSVSSVTVTPTRQDPNATITVNGQAATSGQARPITLNGAGSDTSVNVVVTAPNGTQKTYALTVRRAALGGNNNLSGLTVTPAGSLTPAFNATTTRYTANVGSTVASVTVRATKADSNAVLSDDVIAGAGTATGQSTIQLGAPGTTTVVTALVTAPNGSQKPYRIDVFRALPSSNNNLSALSVRVSNVAQTLSPPFVAPGEASYTVNVAPEVTGVVVRATKDDANATMAIGSVTVPGGTDTGQATFPLNGAGGEPTPISVSVTAQDGSAPKVYAISVIRPAAPTPPDKPAPADLLTADDSCPFKIGVTAENATGTNDDCALEFGSRNDNFTNVTTPRFVIPQPSAGHTPNLYIDGSKVGSVFDAANNILRPTTPLNGNNNGIQHSITSTVTNTATNLESVQSDALIITISTGQSGI